MGEMLQTVQLMRLRHVIFFFRLKIIYLPFPLHIEFAVCSMIYIIIISVFQENIFKSVSIDGVKNLT